MILFVYFLSEQMYARFLLSVVYVLYLPGYSLVEIIATFEKSMKGIEKIAYSFGLSIVVVILFCFLLNYSPWGIRLTPLVLGISLFTMTCILAAAIRKYKNQFKST